MAKGEIKAQIELSADASGVERGVFRAGQALGQLGETAVKAGEKASAGLSKMGDGAEAAAKKIDAATKNLVGRVQNAIALAESGASAQGKLSSKFFESLQRQRGASADVLKPYIDQLKQLETQQNKVIQKNQQIVSAPNFTTSLGATDFIKPRSTSVVLPGGGRAPDLSTSLGASAFGAVAAGAATAATAVDALGKKFDYTTLTAKQTTAALRQVPAQLTDIIVSLQGGQAPLTVLLQQGGQLKDVFGGIGPAARALDGYVASLVNPFTLAAAAAAALALAYKQGTDEIDAYAKALILSGNATGTTVSRLNQQAEAISKVVGTQAKAAEALAQFAADGNVASASIQRFAQVAVQLERTAGQAIGETVKQFSALGKDPLQASIKLNETTRFLTTSLYQQIKALEDQGRVSEAAAAAQNGFAAAMESRTGQLESRLGSIERAWKAVRDTAAEAWSAMLNVGRTGTLDDRLTQARSDLDTLEAANRAARARGGVPTEAFQQRLEQQRQLIYGLTETTRLEGKSAQLQADAARQTQKRIDFDVIAKRNQTEKADLLKKEIELITNAGKAAGASQAEIDKAIAGAKERFKPAKGPKDPQIGIDKSELAFDLSKIKSEADELIRIYSDAERVLEALRSGGLLDEKSYYESRRQFLALEAEAKERAFQQEIARLKEEKLQGKEKIDNDRKIIEAESQLAILKARNSSRSVVLDLEERNAAKQKADAITSARQAAEAYFESQNRQQGRSLQAFGQGPREAVFASGVNQIDDNFAQQERELQNLKVLGKLTEDEYAKRLAIIREFQQKSVQSFTEYYARLIELQGNAAVGASQAAKTYIDEAANVAQSTNDLVSNSLRGLEDGLTDFLTTGKFKYKDFATSIVADINRIIIKQQIANILAGQMGSSGNSLTGFAGSLFSALLGSSGGSTMSSGAFGIGVSGYAMGGSVERGRIVEVNESNGPGELFNVGNRQYLLASQAGQVATQKASSSPKEQAMTIINNFTLSGRPDSSTQAQLAASAGLGVQRALARNT